VAAAVHTLLPGDVACADGGARLETLLGSCVAVVLTDPRRTVGAMCHIVHCRSTGEAAGADGRDADSAIDALYALLLERGLNPRLCEAFVYGGGNMFPSIVDGPHVGDRNGERVLARLAADRVRVRVADLGGACYRKLAWTIGAGPPEVEAVPVRGGER
jgi:chemotaxis protein CheD